MNANELADLVEDMYPSVATMLRQQQAEIEALKKQLYPTPKEFLGVSKDGLPMFKEERNDAGFYMSDAEHYKLKCASQQAEIEALIKEINRYADALGTARNEVRNNKALREHELKAILTEVLDDCGLLKKENQ